MSSFRATIIARTSRLVRAWSLSASHLAGTLLLMSLHIVSEIHELWHAARLSIFGTLLRNPEKILSTRVLV